MLGLGLFRKPQPVLTDGHVLLRLPRGGDYREWAALREQSRAFLEPWEPRWGNDELGRAAWRERMRRYHREFNRGTTIPFFIFECRTGCLVGGITLANIRYGVAQSADIGYWMGESHAGRGLMSRALKLTIGHCFDRLRLHRLEAACIPHNKRSVRVLEKAGFTREGLLGSYLKINGTWQDHYLYALVSDRQCGKRK